MGSTTTTELGLDLRPPFASRALNGFLRKLDSVKDGSSMLEMIEEHVRCLEEERKKIDVFKRELPLCMLILTDVIDGLKEEMNHIQCRDEVANSPPVLEQFLPMQSKMEEDGVVKPDRKDNGDKINWMSSVQLWSDNYSSCNADAHSNSNCNNSGTKTSATDERSGDQDRQSECGNPFAEIQIKSKTGGGVFSPFKELFFGSSPAKDELKNKNVTPLPDLSLLTPGIRNSSPASSHLPEEDRSCGSSSKGKFVASTPNINPQSDISQQQQTAQRKARRCWSPELHRRFVNALQQLGGSQAGTPKQIRELMKVDGLTNDEVKSHLQKYRLHTRRLAPPPCGQTNQHMVVLGGLWASPPDRYNKSGTPQSGSPQGPLQLLASSNLGASVTGGDSCEGDEDEEEGNSESYSWKGHAQQQRSSEEETD